MLTPEGLLELNEKEARNDGDKITGSSNNPVVFGFGQRPIEPNRALVQVEEQGQQPNRLFPDGTRGQLGARERALHRRPLRYAGH